MPWRGPEFEGEFPTLGYQVAEWIESHLVIPDGYRQGEPYLLTDEMLKFLVHWFRIDPLATPVITPGSVTFYPDGLHYTGAQLRRPQKWGKDPFGAGLIAADALGPTRHDGWDASGEPVGAPYPTPLIVCLGTSEDQTANTWRPLLSMLRLGSLIETPGIDVGDTRVILPGGGKIEPVTTSAKARLGAPMTHVNITESHLFTLQGGYRKVSGAVKRNVAGMGGRWVELTNAWDPSEGSEAQVTAESVDSRVYLDHKETHRVEDLSDRQSVLAELEHKYGDSSMTVGGWVNVRGRIVGEVMSGRHLEADARRFFLDEIVVGQSMLVDPTMLDALTRTGELKPDDAIALGFDGSQRRDSTALIAKRLSDNRLFPIRIWRRPPDAGPEWLIPNVEVDAVVRATFEAYRVGYMFCDPWRFQDLVAAWSVSFPGRVVLFHTNVEIRFDRAIVAFMDALKGTLPMTHNGDEVWLEHVKNAVVIKGSQKKRRPGDSDEIATHYLKLGKRDPSRQIDGAVGAILAHAAAIETVKDGKIEDKQEHVYESFTM
jgi:hypothetical protein